MKKPLIYFVAITFVLFLGAASSLAASDNAANKVHATGSTQWEFGPQEEVILLSTSVKTSNVADLLIEFNAESYIYISDYDSLYAYYYYSDSESDFLNVRIIVWVEVDEVPVPVDPDVGDNGRVTFHARYVSDYNYLRDYYGSRVSERDSENSHVANSFRWFAKNVGNGTHTVEVKAELYEYGYGPSTFFTGSVGKRTLVVEPLNNLK